MKRWVWLTAALACVALAICFWLFAAPRKEKWSFAEIAAKRPRPNLATLAERCAPDRNGPDATEAFYDLLKLREQPNPQAIPVLERILTAHAHNHRIHIDQFAAAQALFAIGTPQAYDILARHLLSPGYSAFHGINYAFYHEMNPALRNDFIERYHLRNLAKDLSLTLAVKSRGDSSLLFTVTVTNILAQALSLRDRAPFQNIMLYLRSQDGSFIAAKDKGIRFKGLKFNVAPMKWIHILPGASHEWRSPAKVRSVHELDQPYFRMSKDAQIIIDMHDMYFEIRRPGRFQAIAMIEEQPPVKVQLPSGDGTVSWTGRAVSAPVSLEIRR